MKFKIVVPVYNSEEWIQDCLYSIFFQRNPNFECIIFNDASTDNTKQAIDSSFKSQNDVVGYLDDERFTVIHNEKNVGALDNIVNGFKKLNTIDDPESVLMVIDGDDKLFTPLALDIIEHVYNTQGSLLTYGNWVGYPTGQKSNCEGFPEEIVKNRDYRKYKFITSHLRTFKSKLWNNIKEQDLRNPITKEYWRVGWDVSFMLPMLEMANDKHTFIENVLYTYNRENPLADDAVRGNEQGSVDRYIRTLPKYDILKE